VLNEEDTNESEKNEMDDESSSDSVFFSTNGQSISGSELDPEDLISREDKQVDRSDVSSAHMAWR
jgi:hypothetical protein